MNFILHVNTYAKMQAIFSTIYDFFLFKCEAHLLQLKLVLGVPMKRKQKKNQTPRNTIGATLITENYKTYLPVSFFVDFFLLFCYLEIESQTILDY